MDGDGEMLSGKIGSAHERSGGDVPHSHGIPSRTKPKRPVNEVPIDRSHEGPTVRRRRAQREKTHALKLVAKFGRRESTIVGNDVAKVGTGALRTRVQQPLQPLSFFGSLPHRVI
jgi:hypothetical protein